MSVAWEGESAQSSRPRRVQFRRSPGFRLPPNTVSVARPSKWGNPFRIGDAGVPDRATAVRLYAEWIAARAALVREAARELRGKNLACFCPLPDPGQPDRCHASILLALVNESLRGT